MEESLPLGDASLVGLARKIFSTARKLTCFRNLDRSIITISNANVRSLSEQAKIEEAPHEQEEALSRRSCARGN